jgi:hypothetical protein
MNREQRRSLINELQAAEILGMSVRTLQGWRSMGRGPAFFRLSAAVRYAPDDLEIFMQSGRSPARGPFSKDQK